MRDGAVGSLDRPSNQVVAVGADDLDGEEDPRMDRLGVGVSQIHLGVDLGRLALETAVEDQLMLRGAPIHHQPGALTDPGLLLLSHDLFLPHHQA